MTDEQNHEHPDALLPWHANGTLTGEERRLVEAHLDQCPRCRRELAFLQRLREMIKSQASSCEEPGELGLRRLLRDLDVREREVSRPGGFRWRPALAVAASLVIVIQGVLLLNLWQGSGPGDAGMRLAGEAAVPVARGVIVQIRFAPEARESEIRTLLQAVDGRIVDGPGAIGLYRIELQGVPAGNAADAQAALERLRRHTGVVLHAAME